MTRVLSLAAFLFTLCGVTPTQAADVYGGPEDVTQDGQEAHKASETGVEDATELSIQGGALVAGGNSQSTAATSLARFLLRRGSDELSAAAAVNFARASQENDAGEDIGMETTVENYQGRIRYDHFWTQKLSTFLAVQARRDRFQGLNLRLGVDPGVSYYFVRKEKQLFWAELGYDFQFDVLTQETLDTAAADGTPRDRTETDHNIRGYLGYDLKLGERLGFLAGIEAFKSLVHGPAYRINFNAELHTQIVKRLSLAIGSTTMYNHDPLPGIERLDVTTSVNLVYTIF